MHYNWDEARLWWSENPRRTYDSKGKKRIVIDSMGGASEKSAFTLILGGTSEGLLYPPAVILGGMNRIDKEVMKVGEPWKIT